MSKQAKSAQLHDKDMNASQLPKHIYTLKVLKKDSFLSLSQQ